MKVKITTMFIVTYLPLIIAGLSMFTFVRPCRLKVRAQAIWMMVLLLCAAKGEIFKAIGGHAISPSLPEMVMWVYNLAGSFLFLLFALSLVWWKRRGRVWILPIVALLLSVWGQYEGVRPPKVNEIELKYANLPAELDGYRIMQISDIHCSSAARKWRTQAIVDLSNSYKPDLVCLTGDYVDGEVVYLSDDMSPLKKLQSKDGVYCIRGNHEYYLDKLAWRKWFNVNGFRFLVNECVRLRPSLVLGGVNDKGARKYGDIAPDVAQAFATATNGEFRVLMEHRPESARDNIEHCKVDLQLSGHTHGGIAPGLASIVRLYNKGFVSGIHKLGKGYLYVSRGAGMWAGFPMRFFNRSEITCITLRKDKE